MPEAPEAVSRDEIRSKRLTTEEMVRNQLDRVHAARCDFTVPNAKRIEAWSEAIETLADLVTPWAVEEDRKAKRDNPQGRGQFMQEWDDRPVAVVNVDGEHIVVPTARDCRLHEQIILRLLDRQGLLVKRRNVSGPSKPRESGVASQQVTEEEAAPTLEM